MSIYGNIPASENECFILRPVKKEDLDDLVKVYGDRNALPFFNSDNCDGDVFFYDTAEKMEKAMEFWDYSAKNGWFLRLSIVDKSDGAVIGTVEICLRVSEDEFNGMGILRVDVRSDFETEKSLRGIFTLAAPLTHKLLNCPSVITKAPGYAVERIEALRKNGFEKSPHKLIGKDGTLYGGYWITLPAAE